MVDAVTMCRRLGFHEIAPYHVNPEPGTLYMEVELGPSLSRANSDDLGRWLLLVIAKAKSRKDRLKLALSKQEVGT
jgi:hypothetical protein